MIFYVAVAVGYNFTFCVSIKFECEANTSCLFTFDRFTPNNESTVYSVKKRNSII